MQELYAKCVHWQMDGSRKCDIYIYYKYINYIFIYYKLIYCIIYIMWCI